MRPSLHICIILIAVHSALFSQIPVEVTADTAVADVVSDTIPPGEEFEYRLAPGALQDEASYGADSMFFDNISQKWYMWNNAYVKYLTMTLEADYIVFDIDSSIAVAQGWPDSTGNLSGFPLFKEGSSEFEAKKIRYNFGTSKGKIYDVATLQGDLVIRGAETKYVGAGGDSSKYDYIYNQGAIITSCDHPEPHYGIRASKIKTVPNRFAVIGPSNLELQGVPTPLWLPFGFFPVTTSSRKAGLIFPQDYEYSEAWGFGLRGIGYYAPIGEYIDARILGDIYFNGSWGLQLNTNYAKRYKFRGTVNLGYSLRKSRQRGALFDDKQKSFSLRVSHNQDANAHPYNRLGGSINIISNDYQRVNFNDANSAFQNTYSSNFNWTRTFPNKPITLSMGMSHSQNTQTGRITINAPDIDFRLNRIYPFKGLGQPGGREKWYEKFSIQYQVNSRTRFEGIENDSTSFFSQETWDNQQTGVKHRANADMAFSIAKYLHFTPQVDYEEVWNLKYLQKQFVFDPDVHIRYDTLIGDDGSFIIVPDTLDYGPMTSEYASGFKPFRRVSTGISVNTQLFATAQFKKGWIRGLRHVLKPSLSYTFTPMTNPDTYVDSVMNDIRDPMSMEGYSIFQGTVQSISPVRTEQQLISYSFNNIFEGKFFSKKDSSVKKVKLFDNIIVNGSYNLADTIKWSPVTLRATTRLFKGATTFSFNAVWDPQALDMTTGRRISQTYLDAQGKVLRFDNFQMRFATRLTLQKIKEIFGGAKERPKAGQGRGQERPGGRRAGQVDRDKFIDLFNGFSLNHNFLVTRVGRTQRDTTIVGTHTVNLTGTMNLSPKWRINLRNIGYDFRSKRITYPDLVFTRDLHCWQMSFSWQPERGTYSMTIGVKPGSLDFIKVPHQNNNQNADRFGGF